MSIKDDLFTAVQNGVVVRLTPYISRDRPLRALLMHSEGMEEIVNLEHGDDDWTQRLWELRADLEHFIFSPNIDCNYLKPLNPRSKGVYEIRSRRPKPSIRVFGMFIAKDVFFITHYAKRAELGGGWKNHEFKQEIHKCRAAWRTVFPGYAAKISESGGIKDLVTGGQDEKLLSR